MGLDMYLFALPKIEGMSLNDVLYADMCLGKLEKENKVIYEKVKDHIKHFEEYDMAWDSIREQMAYWRKANQIHHWFVENVQNGQDDCSIYEVEKNHIILLTNFCELILTRKAKPVDVLPTQSGFFFGSTAYDYYYYKELFETHYILKFLLENFSFDDNYLVYQSSW